LKKQPHQENNALLQSLVIESRNCTIVKCPYSIRRNLPNTGWL